MLAIRHDNKHVDALGNLANLYVERNREGDMKKAGATFERALRIKPDHVENKQNYLMYKKLNKKR